MATEMIMERFMEILTAAKGNLRDIFLLPDGERRRVAIDRDTARRYVIPLGKAVGIWLSLYVIVTHLLVIWKWSSSSTMLPRTPGQQADLTAMNHWSLPELQEQINSLHQSLFTYETTVRRIGNERSVVQQAKERLESMQEKTQQQHRPYGVLLPQVQKFLPVLLDQSWQHKYQSTGALRQAFFKVRRELQDAKRFQHPNWHVTNRILQKISGSGSGSGSTDNEDATIDWSYLKPNCTTRTNPTAASAELSQHDNPDHSVIVAEVTRYIEDDERINELVERVVQVLEERHDPDQDWCVSLESTYRRIDGTVEDLVDNARLRLQQAIEQAQQSLATIAGTTSTDPTVTTEADPTLSSSSSQCVKLSQVISWMQVGFDAHYRKQDIRIALLEAMKSDPHINESTVILDMILDEDDDFNKLVELRKNKTANKKSLRYLLDKPLTKQVGHGIDAIIERMEGKVDKLDQWLDAWYTASTTTTRGIESLSATTTLGQWIVQRVLQMAGQLSETYDKATQ